MPTKETRQSNKRSPMEEESDIDLTECSAGEGSSQEADSTTEDNGIEPMVSTILNTEKETWSRNGWSYQATFGLEVRLTLDHV